jgi:hypothetical protein
VILGSAFAVIGANPLDVTKYIGAGLSNATNMYSSASVPPNPMNTLALQLSEKEKKLQQKEQSLDDLQANMEAKIISKQNTFIWIMFAGIGVLLILILTNFILDAKRRKQK